MDLVVAHTHMAQRLELSGTRAEPADAPEKPAGGVEHTDRRLLWLRHVHVAVRIQTHVADERQVVSGPVRFTDLPDLLDRPGGSLRLRNGGKCEGRAQNELAHLPFKGRPPANRAGRLFIASP
jgi:hypothetical protein